MSKHRQNDRDRGLTGETDPQKIHAEHQRIIAENQAATDALASDRLNHD